MIIKTLYRILISVVLLFFSLQAAFAASPTINQPINYNLWQQLLPTKKINIASSFHAPFKKQSKLKTESYSDLDKTHWAYEALIELTERYGVVVGMPNGTFQGERFATRYEMAQALVKAIKIIEGKQVNLSAIEKAAIRSLKEEFDKEIISLAARVEYNTKAINETKVMHNTDVSRIDSDIKKIQKRHFFVPTMRFRYQMGDGNNANARLRLTSKTKLNKDTFGVIRLQSVTNNFINMSESNNDVVDTDLTLLYCQTGALTRWFPEKLGKINLYGGIMPTNWLFWTGDYYTTVDMRAFNNDAFETVGLLSDQLLAIEREVPNGRRISVGGEWIKDFHNKYGTKIQASALRSTGGSLDIPFPLQDNASSGDESTFYAVSAESDLPIKHPVNLKVSHAYMFDDAGTSRYTYNVGGRVTTKFNNIGVFKAAVIGSDGTQSPRILGGFGGKGFSYQAAFIPASKIFGHLFGDPDKISHRMQTYTPGQTEIGVAIDNLHNDENECIRSFDLYIARHLSKNIFARILLNHTSPNTIGRQLDSRTAVLLETIFKL